MTTQGVELEADPVEILSRMAAIDGSGQIELSGAESIALLKHIADLDEHAAMYRWVRTHQYCGMITANEPCDPKSPAAIQFDRSIKRNMP